MYVEGSRRQTNSSHAEERFQQRAGGRLRFAQREVSGAPVESVTCDCRE